MMSGPTLTKFIKKNALVAVVMEFNPSPLRCIHNLNFVFKRVISVLS